MGKSIKEVLPLPDKDGMGRSGDPTDGGEDIPQSGDA